MTKSETNHWNLEFKCPSKVNFKNQRQTKSEKNSKKKNEQKNAMKKNIKNETTIQKQINLNACPPLFIKVMTMISKPT